MVGGETENGIIHERGGDDFRHMGDKAFAWADKFIFDGWKTVLDETPLRDGGGCVPGIVNGPKRSANVGSEIVIDADEFFAPVGWRGDGGIVARADAGIASR